MSAGELLTAIGIIATFLLGLFNLLFRGPSMGMVERGQYLKTVNESISLANARALEAEKRAIAAETKTELLEERMILWEKHNSLILTFQVILGEIPSVKDVKIARYSEVSNELPKE